MNKYYAAIIEASVEWKDRTSEYREDKNELIITGNVYDNGVLAYYHIAILNDQYCQHKSQCLLDEKEIDNKMAEHVKTHIPLKLSEKIEKFLSNKSKKNTYLSYPK